MIFFCNHCQTPLKAEPGMAGQSTHCPTCNSKIEIPGISKDTKKGAKARMSGTVQGQRALASGSSRGGWVETDPTNPPLMQSFLLGLGACAVWFLIIAPFIPAKGKPMAEFNFMELLSNLFYKHFLISAMNTLFFCWAMAILWLKLKKLKHQRAALMLDILPMDLGVEINAQTVGSFVDHVYKLPKQLRDSLMVNRIRKGLELFEAKQDTDSVSHMMDSQSEIDSMRIGGSYTLLKAFLWAIPILGFIGTVMGLSQAIGGMSFANVTEVPAVVASINGVTSGLGTAFDATLLGLVLAMALNFPMNALAKREDDNLNDVDAFCNEVLLPRLRNSVSAEQHESGSLADALVRAVTSAQREFLADLNELSRRMLDYANSLDQRNAEYQQAAIGASAQTQAEVKETLQESLSQVNQYIGGLSEGIQNLNTTLASLGEKQVVIQQVKKKGWFSKD